MRTPTPVTSFRFTKAGLDHLPPATGRVTYHDTAVPGLQLRVTPQGAKSFSYYYRFGGKQHRLTLGTFPTMTIDQARKRAGELLAQLNLGQDPSIAHAAAEGLRPSVLTLREAFDYYYKDHLVPQEKRTREARKDDFSRYLGYVAPGQKKKHGKERTKPPGTVNWEQRPLGSITPADIQKMLADIQRQISARVANRTLELLTAIYRKSIAWKLFPGPNPCEDSAVSKYAEGNVTRTRFLSEAEAPRFFAALVKMPQQFQDFVRLALATGARSENVRGMRWQDLDLDAGIWRIPASMAKNKQPTTLPLSPEARAILRRRQPMTPESAFVFPAKSKSGYITPPKRAWVQFCLRAQMSDFRIHDLRRTLGSWMAMRGVSLQVIGKSLGHRNVSSTQVYAQLQTDTVLRGILTATNDLFAHGANLTGTTSSPTGKQGDSDASRQIE